jgi:hypothetical protein
MTTQFQSDCLFALLVLASASAVVQAAPVHVYEKVDLTLTATGKYSKVL